MNDFLLVMLSFYAVAATFKLAFLQHDLEKNAKCCGKLISELADRIATIHRKTKQLEQQLDYLIKQVEKS